MKENFPSWAKELDMQIQEAQRVPNKLDPRRNTPRQKKNGPNDRTLQSSRKKYN